MSIYLVCIALLALLCLLSGFNVSMLRGSSGVFYGADPQPDSKLYKAQRAHGNTTEYAPILAVLIYALSQSPQPVWVLWCVVLVTVFRYVFVAGILLPPTMAETNPIRFVGALGTYISGLALVVAVLIQATG